MPQLLQTSFYVEYPSYTERKYLFFLLFYFKASSVPLNLLSPSWSIYFLRFRAVCASGN
jgi:hypothetical protein